MKAVALTRYLPASDPQALFDTELPVPVPGDRDILVRVEAISVNPVDTKVRAPKDNVEATPRVLGWDAAGVVVGVGSEVANFRPGDEVYYSGDITRPGCNSECQLVDERIVGRKPASLTFEEAAALPLTTITAWEALYEHMGIDRRGRFRGKSLLIIGGAGGVGSIAIQLGKLAGLRVIATASRPETANWCANLGADQVVNHHQPLGSQLAAAGFPQVDFIANFTNTDAYWEVMSELIRPLGHIVCIVENSAPVSLGLLKSKSVAFTWEFMFTRSMYQTPDMAEQGSILNQLADLVDTGAVRSTLHQAFSPINAAHVLSAHRILESGKAIGKIVLSGW